MNGAGNIFHGITPVILAGGMGKRLAPLVGSLPKALAPVMGRPCIDFILEQLAGLGASRVILATGQGDEHMRATLGTKRQGLELVYSTEPEPLGTGGALRLATRRGWSDFFLVMNGDTFVRVDLERFIRWHLDFLHPASMVLGWVAETSRFGLALTGTGHMLTGFQEKSAVPRHGGLVSTGVLLCTRQTMDAMTEDKAFSLETDLLPLLAAKKLLYYYPEPAEFYDIGTPESFHAADNWFSSLPPAVGNIDMRRP